MATKDPQALVELWEIRTKLYEESKGMPLRNFLKTVHERMKPVVERITKVQKEKASKK